MMWLRSHVGNVTDAYDSQMGILCINEDSVWVTTKL